MLQFGPDGYLYASVGDGDSGIFNAPGLFAQRRDSLLGSILRIDPRAGDPYAVPAGNPFVGVEGALPEIWAYGLRNPWRFWIDHETGVMLIGDAGHERRQEVDLVPRGPSGPNFGWPCFEGTPPFDTAASCDGAVPQDGRIADSDVLDVEVPRLRRRRRRTRLRDLPRRRRVPPRPEAGALIDPCNRSLLVSSRHLRPPRYRRAREFSSATQAAARRPSQIGVRRM
jgi:hypothetical protein